MSRARKITLPYPFCLFGAALSAVLLMGGVVAWEAYRDAKASIPARANAELHATIEPVIRLLAAHFEPAADRLRDCQRWAAAGMLQDSRLPDWPEILLPALSSYDPIETITVTQAHGAFWHLERDRDTWAGCMVDPAGDGNGGAWSQWDSGGERLGGVRTEAAAIDPSQLDWYAALQSSGAGGDTSLYCGDLEATPAGTRITLAIPVHFRDLEWGTVALTLSCDTLLEQVGALSGGAVQVRLDPGGREALQIQDQQTLALLQQQAMPDSASTGLDVLFAGISDKASHSWYAAATYEVGDSTSGTWWILAAADESRLPPAALPVGRYLVHALAVGILAAFILALLLGRQITRPLREVAARARSIQALDEHYRPWPESPFTEINALTVALEDLYESAVEHLDYHDAPLVVWAQPEDGQDGTAIETEAVRHVMKIPRGQEVQAETPDTGPVIDVRSDRNLVPAVQIQALQGTRREVRRLQGQLAGAFEELRTTAAHQRQDETRLKAEQKCLRHLDKLLREEGAVSPTMLGQVRDILGAGRVSLWIARGNQTTFRLRLATEGAAQHPHALESSLRLRAVLADESAIMVSDPRKDPRLDDLYATSFLKDRRGSLFVAPLKVAGQVLGFLLVEQLGATRRWKGDEEIFLVGVAAQCAAVLWQQLRQRAAADMALGPRGLARTDPGAIPNGNGNGNSHTNGKKNGHANGPSALPKVGATSAVQQPEPSTAAPWESATQSAGPNSE